MKAHKSLALLLTTLTLLAAAPVPSTQPRWRTLLPQLGDADFATRQEAQKELDKTTPADISTLRDLAKTSTDEEIKSRLLARVVTIEEDIAVNPPPLTLKLENATLTEVAAAMNKQMGTQLTVWPPQEDFRRNIRYTINLKDKSLHEILAELSKQHAVSMQDIGDELRLNAQEQPAMRQAVFHGPIAIYPTSITRSRSFDLQAPPGPRPAEQYNFNAVVSIDPRLAIQARGEPQFTEIIDDLGNVLLRKTEENNSPFNRNVREHSFAQTLSLPEKPGTKIVSAKGIARFKIVIASDRLEIPDAAAKSGQSFEFAGQTIKLAQFTVQGTSINFNITMNKIPTPAAINQNGLADNGLRGTDQIELGMQFIDANDKSIFSNSLRNGGHSGDVGRGELKPPVKVVLTLPTKIKELVVPFELKDIPLP